MNFKKMSAKALSVFMSLLMIFSVVAPAVSAADWEHAHVHGDKEELNYVSLGDSMTNGFGLFGYDYEFHADGSEHTAECDCTDYKTWTYGNGYMQEVKDAYPSRFAAYLAGYTGEIKNDQNVFEGLFGKVTLSQMAMSSMRVEDLYWILNADTEDEIFASTDWSEYDVDLTDDAAVEAMCEKFGCDKYTYVEMLYRRLWEVSSVDGKYGSSTPKAVIEAYQNAVKNADVISIGSGNANFGVFMLHRIVASMGLNILGRAYNAASFTEDFDLDAILATCDEKLVAKIAELRAVLEEKLYANEQFAAYDIENMIDIVLYTTVSFCKSYEGLLDTISTLNPDAEIIIVGLMKTVDGMNFVTEDGVTIDLDEIMGEALGVANAYISAYASVKQFNNEYTNNIYYAEVPTVETIVATYEETLKSENGKVMRDRFVDSIVGTASNPGMVWKTLEYDEYITLADVEAFEANRAAYAAANSDKVEMIITYLAFEAAVVKATKTDINLDLATVKSLQDLSSAFDGVMSNLTMDEEALTLATLEHLKAGAPNGATGADKEIFTEIFRFIADNSFSTPELVNVFAQVFKQNEGATTKAAHRKNIREFFKVYANLGAEGVVEKIIDILVEDTWNSEAVQTQYETAVQNFVDGGLSEEAATTAAEIIVKDQVRKGVEEGRATIEYIVATLISTYEDLYNAYVADAYASEALLSDSTVAALINLFGRSLIGNGLGGHPSANGHDALFASVKNAYVNEHTVVDETVNNIVILRDYIFENYTKFYAYAYDKAVEEGLIAEIDAYLVEAINAVRYAENWANGYEEYFRSEDFAAAITDSANSTVASIEALRAVLANADELDADLNASIVALVAQLEANLGEFTALINAAIADAYAYGAPIVDAEVAHALAVINAKVNAVLETIAYIEAKVQEQIAIAEALIAKYVEIAETYLAKIFDFAAANGEDIAELVAAKVAEAKAYLAALLNAFLSNSAYETIYTVTADSYYVAIDANALYADILADKMGIGKDQYTVMDWNNLDSSIIAKADLITIGYTESMISGFATEQIIAYIANYINSDLRASATEYAVEALTHFFAQIPAVSDKTIEGYVEKFEGILNEKIDGVLAENGLADREIESMDWAALVGEENVAYIDGALDAITAALVEAGLPAVYTESIPVFDLLLENLDEIDPSIAFILAYFEVDEIKAMFGEYANYELELPVADFVKFAAESYLYSYVKFNVEYAQLVYAINKINPDAQVVLLGNYNAIEGLGNVEFDVPGYSFGLDSIFTSDIQNSANSYANEVFEKIFGTLDNALDDEKIDSALGSVDSAITSGASTLYDIILGVLADAETVRDYINGTVVELPEMSAPACPELEAVLAMLGKINPDVLVDVDWEKLVGFDAVEVVVAASTAINNAIAEVENALVELGIFESHTITLPTLDFIYANLDKFDAETRAMIEALDQAELRAMLGDLADYVVEVKTLSTNALNIVNGIYNDIAAIEIPVFAGASFSIDFGTILSAPTTIQSLVYAYSMKNVIFVDIAGADVAHDAEDLVEFIMAYLADNSVADVTEAGHAYIAEQIYNALNVVCGHRDADNDHVCDYCGETISACVDNNKDHYCDYCNEALTSCVDADNDHYCDYCSAKISDCADNNKDHNCDVCGKELSKCADANNDHKCDVCGTKITDCADGNKDHNCDVCGTKLTDCADGNNDHNCDVCGKKLTDCADANNDHNCDLCGAKVSECADDNHDHKCDICGNTVSECQFGDWYTVVEATKKSEGKEERKCSICGATEERVIPELPGLTAGAVVAIVAGSAVAAAGIGFAIYWFVFRKKKLA